MNASARAFSRSLLPAGVVLLASALVTWLAPPPLVRILLPALAALSLGPILWRTEQGRHRTQASLADANARNAMLVKAAAEMRHDLRGILSPALLTADRLAMSQDPASKRAGEAMISTVERAEERLRRD